MYSYDPNEVYELGAAPNVEYVIDAHGEGWYCTGIDESDPPTTGECVHEEDVPNVRDSGG